jgi:ABC-2 type transport system permease protein
MLIRLKALWRKETISLLRDTEGVAVLFLMPMMFILIMSFALKDAFNPQKHAQLTVAIIQEGKDAEAQAYYERLNDPKNSWSNQKNYSTRASAQAAILERKLQAAIIVPADPNEKSIPLLIDGSLAPTQLQLFESQVLAITGEHRAKTWAKQLGAALPMGGGTDNAQADGDNAQSAKKMIQLEPIGKRAIKPNATQQSVPAWLVFALFFIVSPISNVFLAEREMGTLTRLKALGIPPIFLLIGKFLPYFILNQLQTIALLLLGRYIMPLLGADPFLFDFHWDTLFVLSSALSLAAIGWSLFIAVVVRTAQQASVIGGTSNMVMAAIGGIMVPKFVMPSELRFLSQFSPMNWGLEAFHELILYQSTVAGIAHQLIYLCSFGLICFTLAAILLYKQRLSS